MSDNPLMWSNNPNSDIDETSQGGLVIYATVFDNSANPRGNPINNYGVRVRNGDQLRSSDPSHPQIQGLTFATDQAMYVQGDYNRDDRPGDLETCELLGGLAQYPLECLD